MWQTDGPTELKRVSCILYRVFHLRRDPDYRSICKVWSHQYNKTKFCFYLLRTTYRVPLRQMLEMSNTFLKAGIQRPSNQNDLYSSVTERLRVLYRRGPVSDLIFVPQYVIVLVLRFECHVLLYNREMAKC